MRLVMQGVSRGEVIKMLKCMEIFEEALVTVGLRTYRHGPGPKLRCA